MQNTLEGLWISYLWMDGGVTSFSNYRPWTLLEMYKYEPVQDENMILCPKTVKWMIILWNEVIREDAK